MTWTSLVDLRSQVQKLWDNGDLLRGLMEPADWQPRRLRLVGPASAELASQVGAVRHWLEALRDVAQVRVVWRAFSHRVLGECTLPDQVWLDTPQDGLALLGKTPEARRFEQLLQSIRDCDALLAERLWPWLAKRALTALALSDDWPRMLAVVQWLQAHPGPVARPPATRPVAFDGPSHLAGAPCAVTEPQSLLRDLPRLTPP